MKITGAQVFEARGAFVSRDLYVDGGMLTDRDCGGEVLDAGGCYAIPGLTDIHFHGAVGHDFSDGDADGRQAIAEYELSRGVTQICPAGMTLLPEALEKMCAVFTQYPAAPTVRESSPLNAERRSGGQTIGGVTPPERDEQIKKQKGLVAKQPEKNNEVWSRKGFPNLVVCFKINV